MPTPTNRKIAADYPRVRFPAWPGVVRELFRRWPSVPPRELERIRRALIRCQEMEHPGRGHQLSEPALALLELMTSELSRRRGTNDSPEPAPAPDASFRKHQLIHDLLKGHLMAGHFELVSDPEGRCRVKLVDPEGKEIAVSTPFTDRKSAVEAITTIREVAATAPVRDYTTNRRTAAARRFNAARQGPRLSPEHQWTKNQGRHDAG